MQAILFSKYVNYKYTYWIPTYLCNKYLQYYTFSKTFSVFIYAKKNSVGSLEPME